MATHHGYPHRQRGRRKPSENIRILMLEADEAAARLINTGLRKSGPPCSVTHAKTKEDYLKQLQVHAPHAPSLILAAYSVPGFSGFEALELAKQNCPETPFIFTSASMVEGIAIEARTAGAEDYVLKTNLVRMVTTIQRAFLQSQARGRVNRQIKDYKEKLRTLGADFHALRTKHAKSHGSEQSDKAHTLERFIEFPPQYKQAGVAILSQFSDILAREYPQEQIAVSILQSGSLVTLKIIRTDGKIEEIQKRLDEYGMAVTGRMPLEEFSRDKELIRELKTRLEVMALELRLRQEFFLEGRQNQENRILSLEDQLSRLQAILAAGLAQTSALPELFKTLAAKNIVSDDVIADLTTITRLAESEHTQENEKDLRDALEHMRENKPSLYKRVVAQMESIPATVLGNLATTWVQALIGSLPK